MKVFLAECMTGFALSMLSLNVPAAAVEPATIQCDSQWFLVPHPGVEDSTTSSPRVCHVVVSIEDLPAAPSILFQDNQDEALFVKTKSIVQELEDGTKETTWFGTSVDDEDAYSGSATLRQIPGGKAIIGKFTTTTTAYTLKTAGNGYVLEAVSISAMPTARRLPVDTESSTGSNANTPVFQESKQSPLNKLGSIGAPPKKPVGKSIVSFGDGKLPFSPRTVRRNLHRTEASPANRTLQGDSLVDIMFILTHRALCEFDFVVDQFTFVPIRTEYPCDIRFNTLIAHLDTEIQIINEAFRVTGTNVRVRNVGKYTLDFDYHPTTFAATNGLDFMLYDSEVNRIRNEIGADLIAMIGGVNPTNFPGGFANATERYNYVSITAYNALSIHLLLHEIDNFLCDHNIGNAVDDVYSDLPGAPYAYGKGVDGVLRTVMAYDCPDTCPVVPFFSDSRYSFGGTNTPSGSPTEDNARWIRAYAPTVANFRSSRPTGAAGPQVPEQIPPPPPPPPGSSSFCFSSSNTVEVQDEGRIRIKDLKIGDFVRTDSDGRFSRVYSFGHRDAGTVTDYLQIHAGSKVIEISDQHFLFVNDGNAVKASSVQVGDRLGSDTVRAVKSVRRHGLYAPLTESGEIEVSGVRASNFVNLMDLDPKIQVQLYQAVLAPLRIVCQFSNYCKTETYPNGYSSRVAWLIQFGVTFAKYTSSSIQFVAVLLISPILGCFFLMEKMVWNPGQVMLLVFALIALKVPKLSKQNVNQATHHVVLLSPNGNGEARR